MPPVPTGYPVYNVRTTYATHKIPIPTSDTTHDADLECERAPTSWGLDDHGIRGLDSTASVYMADTVCPASGHLPFVYEDVLADDSLASITLPADHLVEGPHAVCLALYHEIANECFSPDALHGVQELGIRLLA